MVIGKGVLNGLKYACNCLKVLRDYVLLPDIKEGEKRSKEALVPKEKDVGVEG